MIARGTIGGLAWSAAVNGDNGPEAGACFSSFIGSPGAAARSAGQLMSVCAPNVDTLVGAPSPNPAELTGGSDRANDTTYDSELGRVAADVTYLELTFTDGQQLKLTPVTWRGHRYVAWVVPASMTIASLTAHLGGPRYDSGQTSTAVPYDPPDGIPMFGLWYEPGQAMPPTASGVIGGGTHDGRAWSASAYEGPWGTCFVQSPGDSECVQAARLGTTQVLGGWDSNPAFAVFGSVAPDVKTMIITLSDAQPSE